jgi:hypothetical protein
MVYPGTLFIGDNGAFLCIPMKLGFKFEHGGRTAFSTPLPPQAASPSRSSSAS